MSGRLTRCFLYRVSCIFDDLVDFFHLAMVRGVVSNLHGFLYHVFQISNRVADSPVSNAFESIAAWARTRWGHLNSRDNYRCRGGCDHIALNW